MRATNSPTRAWSGFEKIFSRPEHARVGDFVATISRHA